MRLRISCLGTAAALLALTPATSAQQATPTRVTVPLPFEQTAQRETASTQGVTHPGQIATSAVGQVGQRQTAASFQAEPMGRVNNRIQNRVQNRIRNRIDRSYNPTANTTSPFEVAAEQTTRGQPAQ